MDNFKIILINFVVFVIFLQINEVKLNRFSITKCLQNEEYRNESCESTCDKLFSRPCYDEEMYSGCFCKSGFVRDDTTDKCFPIEDCSKRICKKPNTELYLKWKITMCSGPGTTRTYNYPQTILPICFCKEGYASYFGDCVPVSKCM
ncbi:uncharacterized protein LOC111619616 [Centruroides sculpturatus]|uniref:uncharacterized protein LOC111619616 n=1 Tax=Centruroides sculpturatus TaxID=218467 RepID=UPI000C6E6B9E|nr:uncharacterized protein LOC111619616 [Centruroides sculpturatus]